MIATDRFVFVHLPKTGGSFVASVLHELGDLLGSIDVHRRWFLFRVPLKHATRQEIPRSHADLPILGCLRGPLDRYVSQYEFGWWRRREYRRYYRRVEGFERRFPTFPDLDFGDFVRLYNATFADTSPREPGSLEGLGHHSEQLLDFFARDPSAARRAALAYPPRIDLVTRELDDVTFVETRDLNAQLADFLLGLGYPEERIRFVREWAPIQPREGTRRGGRDWREYYTDELLEWVVRKEWLFFRLFPSFATEAG